MGMARMTTMTLAATAAVLAVAGTSVAVAGTRTTVKTDYYTIKGDTGEALLKAMDRSGPRHGFMARAIAQTRYTVQWNVEWSLAGKTCRVKSADVVLAVSYRYPAIAGTPSPALKRKWDTFMRGVRKHEETHGRIARQMVTEASRSALRVTRSNDPSCAATKREVSRIVHATYADYEARQQRFDALEHQPGGNVERFVARLTARR